MTGHFCDLCGVQTDMARGFHLAISVDGKPTWQKFVCQSCSRIIVNAVNETASKLNIGPVLPKQLLPDEDSPKSPGE